MITLLVALYLLISVLLAFGVGSAVAIAERGEPQS